MTRVRTVVFVGLLALFLGLATSRTAFFTIFYAIVLVLLVTFFWARLALSRVQLVRQTRARRAQVGSILNENFTVRNRGAVRNMWLEVNDESDLPGHHASHIISNLSARAEYTWKIRTYCRERGRFRLGPITLTSGDPFGLFRIKYHLPHTSSVVVYPRTVMLRSFPLPIGMLPGGDALRRRTHYITTNAAGTVEYHKVYSDGGTDNNPGTLDYASAGTKSFSFDNSMSAPHTTTWIDIYIDSPNHQQFGRATYTCP